MSEKDRDAIEEGFRSYFRNKGALQNPYPKDSQLYFYFERGWVQALKQSPDTESKHGFDDSLAGKYSGMGKRKPVCTESTYNAYAAAKGKE